MAGQVVTIRRGKETRPRSNAVAVVQNMFFWDAPADLGVVAVKLEFSWATIGGDKQPEALSLA